MTNNVRDKGLEPPRVSSPDPKSGASANSANPGRTLLRLWPLSNSWTIVCFKQQRMMVLARRIELPTYWLQVSCSTSWAKPATMVECEGLEPRPLACKASALPAELTLEFWWPVRDLNPWMHAWKACVLTASPTGQMAPSIGLEPMTCRLTAECSTYWAN